MEVITVILNIDIDIKATNKSPKFPSSPLNNGVIQNTTIDISIIEEKQNTHDWRILSQQHKQNDADRQWQQHPVSDIPIYDEAMILHFSSFFIYSYRTEEKLQISGVFISSFSVPVSPFSFQLSSSEFQVDVVPFPFLSFLNLEREDNPARNSIPFCTQHKCPFTYVVE